MSMALWLAIFFACVFVAAACFAWLCCWAWDAITERVVGRQYSIRSETKNLRGDQIAAAFERAGVKVRKG